MGQVRLTGRLICRGAQDLEILRSELAGHVSLTRAEPGCLSFEVCPSDDPLIWQVDECFADRAAFEAHQRRTRASAWGTATAGIPRDYEISEDIDPAG